MKRKMGVSALAWAICITGAAALAADPATPPATAPATQPAAAIAAKPKAFKIDLELNQNALSMDALRASQMGYMPAGFILVDEKPAAITKEPTYMGKPKYGAFRIGNGPHSITYLAVDEAKGQTGKIYIDLNQDGDLTNDGDGAWQTAKDTDGTLNYSSTVALHASWGNPVKEDESGTYSVMMYKRHGGTNLSYVKTTARTGKVELDGKTYNVLLSENTNDGIFTVPAFGDRTRHPLDFMIDLDGDGTFKGATATVDGKNFNLPERFAVATQFKVGEQWWLVRPSVSGAELLFSPSSAPGEKTTVAAQEPSEKKELLAAGVAAPDFTANAPDGTPIKLSSFKGKVVILDFWATWCGPCQASMPGLQKTYDGIKDQGVVVFSVNVWDDKDPFDNWIAAKAGKIYNFTFAIDPAGRDSKKSIAGNLFNVSGIPTMYVIGRDGKVAAAIVGSGNEAKLIKVLEDQGIKVKAEAKAETKAE